MQRRFRCSSFGRCGFRVWLVVCCSDRDGCQVLQAVATYKHLAAWVSTTLLSRLITKKVWTDRQLWSGFILCAERTEPNSFDALLQLPKEQLRDLVEKRPVMKPKLRDWLTKKAGKNKARFSGFFEVLGDDAMDQT